jgi:ATP-binding cassette subfamily B protein
VKRLSAYVFRHRRDVAISLTGAILGSACQVVVPLLERQIVDGSIVHRTSPLWPWLIALLVLAAATFGFAYLRRYHGGRVALTVQYDLRNEMHAHLQRMDFANLDTMPTGQLVARANSDTALVQGLLSFLPIMSGNVLMMCLSLAVMLYLSPLLAIVTVVIVPVLLAVSYRMRQRIFPASWDAQQREGDVAQIVDEDVNGVRVVKAFGQERRELQRVVDSAGVLYASQMRAVRLQARYQPVLQAVPAVGQAAVLALGGWLALHGHLSLGTFLAFSTYVAQLMAPARQLAGVLSIGQQARAGVERIFQLLDLQPGISDAPSAVALDAIEGAVSFEDVHFGYTDGPDVLRGLSFSLRPGERVAIVGPSGSGKTTATLMIPRFYDTDRGVVRIDGRDVRTVSLPSLRRQIGVVFEESFLFSDSVRANIAYGNAHASLEQIETAASIAEAHDFISALPQGYDTRVGERGLTLSGGQRQRIALARAILSDPRILILDDATSAVDARTEEAINQALRQVMVGRTTLLVAHRRSTLHLADRVLVMDEGRVVDEGTHDELAERSPLYRALLTGLVDETEAEAGSGRIEALATMTSGLTASAWQRSGAEHDRQYAARPMGAPSLGAGLGGGAGGGWRMNLAPSPDLLEKVAALEPIRDEATVDVAAESQPDPAFTLPRLMREFRRPLAFGLVLVVLDALASLAGPILVKTGIDEGVVAGSERALFTAAAFFLLVTVADIFVESAETFVTGRTAQRVMLSLRIRIWAQLQRLSLDYYEREMAGRIMTRMTTDVDQFESLIQNGLLSALVSFVTFGGVGVALVIFNAELGLLTLSIVIPLAIATVAFRRKSARLYDIARDRIAVVNADFQESLSGVREAQAFVHEAAAVERFRGLGTSYLDVRVAAQRLVATYFPFVLFLSAAADAIVLGVGAGLIHSGELTAGALIAFILYVDLFFSPIQQLSQVFDSWQQTRISVGRIADLMRLETLTPQASEPSTVTDSSGELRLEDVRFVYPGSEFEALSGVDLHIAPGETVALVGETGAGKSTVMKLLIRFYDPTSGRVALDGHDLRGLDLSTLRGQLGYVPQEAFLFTGTVRDNIAYGRPDATDEEVEAAARAVGAHDFVVALPHGYLHTISERGRSLSAGQRQLIALARAELVDPAVLLLDEATSNLDLATEAQVSAAMERVSRHRTTVVIAHRLQTARTADRIVVLESGRVVESGSHDDLVSTGGRYASMWQAFELLGGARAPTTLLD